MGATSAITWRKVFLVLGAVCALLAAFAVAPFGMWGWLCLVVMFWMLAAAAT